MTNIIGHGHVIPRDDGYKANCGGPAVCGVCQSEAQSNFCGYAFTSTSVEPVAILCGPDLGDKNPYEEPLMKLAGRPPEVECPPSS